MAAPLDALVNPPFATNPPIRLSVDAKFIGLGVAILAGLFGLIGLYDLLVLLNAGIQPSYAGIWVVLFVDTVVNLLADAMGLIGGWRMFKGNPAGKRLAIYGLTLSFLVQALLGLGFGTGPSLIVWLILLAMLYYAVVVSRFTGDGLATNR